MLVFYFLAAVLLGLGVLSLRGGVRFAGYVRHQLAAKLSDYTPYVSVIAPVRGLEQDLKSNLLALVEQDYPAYEILYVSDQPDDPALKVVEEIIAAEPGSSIDARVVIAGEAIDCGQKVHNLKIAVTKVDSRCEVLVFVDSDARPDSKWLRLLVAPLADEGIGATTGYRWFITRTRNFASHLRSVWNASIASALGGDSRKNFCWGGSTAIRRSTFERLRVTEAWQGTVSDDFALTRVLQEATLPIHFVPACLVPSSDDCTALELLEFTNRQLRITRVYAPHLWRPLLIGSMFFTLVFFGGLGLVIVRILSGLSYALPLLLLGLIFILGAAKAYLRLKAVADAMHNNRNAINRSLASHVLLWPIASALFLWNAIVAGFSRRIEWRGITYELKSASEAVIIRRT